MDRKRCQICGRTVAEYLACPKCAALFYCSTAHAKHHWRHGHSLECGRMMEQIARTHELATFPFCFTAKNSSVDASDLLRKLDVHWQDHLKVGCASEPGIWGQLGLVMLEYYATHTITNVSLLNVSCLQADKVPCLATPVQDGRSIRAWASYYADRKLPLDSPIALLMDTTLTLHYGLCQLADSALTHRCTVHIVGCQRELDEWPLFLELACLWPHLDLRIVFISPEMADPLDGKTFSWRIRQRCRAAECPMCSQGSAHMPLQGCMHLEFAKGLYHDVYKRWPTPTMVFCPNAGLAVYPSWQPTVRALLTEAPVPLLITDFCEEAALLARNLLLAELQVTRKLVSLGVSKPQVNPFRRPVSCQGDDNCLPSYSNCFYFWCTAQGPCQDSAN